jgi:copper chaperone CopZ
MHVMNVEGMTCEGCKQAISNAISHAVPGIRFEVDLARKQVRVGDLPADRLALVRNAIRDAGYSILDS